ncbi:hypothetical protein LZ32DRAFT_97785 [Colletotrichum eremochloae]|nr:hypothetical protein LZ32DRAFT_97785 [Colletotrichum eremochloae]
MMTTPPQLGSPESPPRPDGFCTPRKTSPSGGPPPTPRATSRSFPGQRCEARNSLLLASPGSSDPTPDALLPSTSFRPPPPLPRPWTWRCHNCNTLARLACTQRCLRCGHRLCTRSGRRRGRVCLMEFDYQRWRAWATWRDGVRGSPSRPPPSEGRPERRGRQRGRRTDCWRECDYPSECHHLRATTGRGEVMAQSGSGSRAKSGSVAGAFLDHDGSSSSTTAINGESGTVADYRSGDARGFASTHGSRNAGAG